ncbi:MAG: aspartate aminotransferase family protein [Dehalococcoidales bacterium]
MTVQDCTEELLRISRAHLIYSYTPIGSSPDIIFEDGNGIVLKDTRGKEYVDFGSGLVNVNIGHGRKELAEAAMAQMSKLGFTPSSRGTSHTAAILCAKKLVELIPEGLGRVFFCCTGSDAVDSAFKAARLYGRKQGKDKYKIISLHNSFHGYVYGTLSATGLGNGIMARSLEPLLPGFVHIPAYNCYRCFFGLEYPDCDTRCARFLAEAIEREDEDTVAAFIAEPIQGSGGFICPPPTYWPLVRNICTEHNVLLIADEIMSGFGRTGKLFAMEHWGVKPDIMAIGKGITSGYIPFSAMAVTDRVIEGLPTTGLPQGGTYSAHPVSCAVAIRNMEILVQEKLTENAAAVGEHIMNRLSSEFMQFDHVGNVNGLGLMCGFELVVDKDTRAKFDPAKAVGSQVLKRARDQGVLLRQFRDWLGLAPPLTVTLEEADRAIEVIKPIVSNVRALLG